MVRVLGGVYVEDLNKGITHLIVGDRRDKKATELERRGNVCFVDENWIYQCLHKKTLISPEAFRVLPLKGVRASTSGFTDPEVRANIAKMLKSLGAHYYSSFQEKVCTHLIVEPHTANIGPDGKYYHAKLWEISVIGLNWLKDCFIEKKWFNEKSYEITIPEDRDEVKQRTLDSGGVFSNKVFVLHNIQSGKERVISFIEENSGRVYHDYYEVIRMCSNLRDINKNVYIVAPHGIDKDATSFYSHPIVSIQWLEFCVKQKALLDFAECPPLFHPLPFPRSTYNNSMSEFSVCLSGFNDTQKEYLKALTLILGATFHPNLKPKRTTHLLCNVPGGKKFETALRVGIHIVKPNWLYACSEKGVRVDEGNFRLASDKSNEERMIKADPLHYEKVPSIPSDPLMDPPTDILKDVVIFIHKSLYKLQPRIVEELNSMGGNISCFCDESVTHYVYNGKHETTKEFRQLKDNGVHIVNPEWIFKCREYGKRVSETLFPSNMNLLMNLHQVVEETSDNPKKILRRERPKRAKRMLPQSNFSSSDYSDSSENSCISIELTRKSVDEFETKKIKTIENGSFVTENDVDNELDLKKTNLLKELLTMAPSILQNSTQSNSFTTPETTYKTPTQLNTSLPDRRITRSELSSTPEKSQSSNGFRDVQNLTPRMEGIVYDSQSEEAFLRTSIQLKNKNLCSPSKSVVYKGNEMDINEKKMILENVERQKRKSNPGDDKLFYDELNKFNEILKQSGKLEKPIVIDLDE